MINIEEAVDITRLVIVGQANASQVRALLNYLEQEKEDKDKLKSTINSLVNHDGSQMMREQAG